MTPPPVRERRRAAGRVLVVAAVLLIALDLRSGIAAVPPLLTEIRADLGMSAAAAGLVTAIPVLCFALLAPAVTLAGRRAGVDAVLLAGCLLVCAGSLLRVLDGTAVLLAGTVLVGAGITTGNVLVPVVVRRDVPRRTGPVTGLYIATMSGGAMLAAAAAVPLAGAWGWRPAVAIWAAPALLAAAVWAVRMRRPAPAPAVTVTGAEDDGGPVRLRRSPVAWGMALFLGAQAAAYYTMTTWLPTLLTDEAGVPAGTAGTAMSAFQALGIAGSLTVPLLAAPRRRRGWLALLVAAGWLVTSAGLLLWPDAWPVWTATGGLAQGGGIGLAMALIALGAGDVATTRRLSGMVQGLGYLIAAAAPVGIGAAYQATGGWTVPLLALVAASFVMAAAGWAGGRELRADTRWR